MSWDQPDSDPVGDMRRAIARMRDEGHRPSVMVVPPWMMEWPQRLMFLGYTTLDRTRPWPRIVLFPRWDALDRRARAWWRWTVIVRWGRVRERLHGRRSEW